MAEPELLHRQINKIESLIKELEAQLTQSLKGVHFYKLSANLEIYQRRQKTLKHYLKLPPHKQIDYCKLRALYVRNVLQAAKLHHQNNNFDKALFYHLKALTYGNLHGLFQPQPHTPLIPFHSDNQFKQALAHFLGIGLPQNFVAARRLFQLCVVDDVKSVDSHFCLGLIYFYGLVEKPDIILAKTHFTQAKKTLPVARQYLGLSELEEGRLATAKRHLKKTLKLGFPLSQTAMGLMREQGNRSFFKQNKPASDLYTLSREQSRILTGYLSLS